MISVTLLNVIYEGQKYDSDSDISNAFSKHFNLAGEKVQNLIPKKW